MKKFLLIILVVLFAIVILISNFSVDIGNVRIGKQVDLVTVQNKNFEESDFFKDYYSKDTLTVLNLWATWCKPCIQEMPDLNKIKTRYNKEIVKFISLSIDKDSVKLVHFLKKEKFDFHDITFQDLKYRRAILNTLENREPEEHIFTYTVPLTYLVKNNKVLKKINGTIEPKELINLIEQNK